MLAAERREVRYWHLCDINLDPLDVVNGASRKNRALR
jgi:hypothetical protein